MMLPHEELEKRWAKWNGLDPAGMVACSSGTAALHLALEVARDGRVRRGILMPDLTMVACARAVVLAGLKPTFVPCRHDLLMDLDQFDPASIRPGTMLALMAVHVYGRRADMGYAARVADDHGMLLVEDLAEAHGVRPDQSSFAACWSFYRNKIVFGEEGGAAWFRNRDDAALARSLRSLGFTDAHDFTHVPRGHNYRMSNLHAQAILPSIDQAHENLAERRKIEEWHESECPEEWKMRRRDVVWVYDLRIRGLRNQDEVVGRLKAEGIQARHCFKPMTRLDEWKMERGEMLQDVLAREVIYLPTVPGITTRESVRKAFEMIRATAKVS